MCVLTKEFNGFRINQKIRDKITGEEYLIFDWGYSDKFRPDTLQLKAILIQQ